MIITIDGPAGAGKSSVARELANRLGFQYLDTGAMYRTVALAGLRAGVNWNHPKELASLAPRLRIELRGDRVFLDAEDVSAAIRSREITAVSRYVADNTEIRSYLVKLQRQLASTGNFVSEGRDQGTLAFPQADFKFFLTASPEERARRRLRDLEKQGESATLEDVLAAQEARDQRDAQRKYGKLVRAEDAIEVCTDGLSLEGVVDQLAEIVEKG